MRHGTLVDSCLSSGSEIIERQLRLTYRNYFQQREPQKDRKALWGLVDRNWARLEQSGVGIWDGSPKQPHQDID